MFNLESLSTIDKCGLESTGNACTLPRPETSYASGMGIREIWVINSKLTPYSMHHPGKLFNLSVLPFSPFGLLREINETVTVIT